MMPRRIRGRTTDPGQRTIGMAKLHEVLAVESDLEATSRKMVEEAEITFNKKADHFIEAHRRLVMFKEEDKNQETEEHKAMVTTVPQKLDYVSKSLVKYLDAVLQKDCTNQEARADLVVNGVTIAEHVPATFLLGLDSKLKKIREMYLQIPTLSPGVEWKRDDQSGPGVYVVANPEVKFKTAQTVMSKVLYDATDKHPAQIDKWTEQVPVGRYETVTKSGMMSSADKSALLGRIDDLIRATKRARSRANGQEVAKASIGNKIFDFIHNGGSPLEQT